MFCMKKFHVICASQKMTLKKKTHCLVNQRDSDNANNASIISSTFPARKGRD